MTNSKTVSLPPMERYPHPHETRPLTEEELAQLRSLHQFMKGSVLSRAIHEISQLREFAAFVMGEVWEHNDPDMGSIQDTAEKLGLIELRPVDPEDAIDGEGHHFFLAWSGKVR